MTQTTSVGVPSYAFSNTWFADASAEVWEGLLAANRIDSVLEIGSYEGASACFLVDRIAAQRPLELHCVDTWSGGIEHRAGGTAEADMGEVERRFRHNIGLACGRAAHPVDLHIHKAMSDQALAGLMASGRTGHFDFVYVDGSHEAPDVLLDALLGFKLLKVGGILGFDDYWWHEALPQGRDPIRTPKIAIDAFANIFCRKTETLWHPNHQVYLRKTSD
ncbi:class I SAM-dependent methyltransferase [Roseomonas sp. PWR1]|uniref:Class I SAM-dependent methyltransferase n=1 Tax=Roseomonas nitratireducens TaxID=2820810 RepID=A0ABS4AVS7_9PROT|nr:class I SAM-dependent methyltransferase [Neoroseomonas nitratireducens]MBP0464667.1 class I SAM-dependent methyltransferase [Neoroseomonas nitratireducens]